MSNAIDQVERLAPTGALKTRLINCMRNENITDIEHAANWLASGNARECPNMGVGCIGLLNTILEQLNFPVSNDNNAEPDVPTYPVMTTCFYCGIDSHRHTTKSGALTCIKKQARQAKKGERKSRVLLIVNQYCAGESMAAIGRQVSLSGGRVAQILQKASRQVRTEARRLKLQHKWLGNYNYWREDKLNEAPIDVVAALACLDLHLSRLG